MNEPKMVVESVSPNGNVQAFVEQDDRVAYFYLWGGADSSFGTRSCWVRNLQPGYANPAQMAEAMQAGRAPMLDRSSCSHPQGARPLTAEHLRIVWFEEGDAAALLEGEEVLAVIPGWSGQSGFHGYARDCLRETPVAWPLACAFDVLSARIQQADAFWQSWDGGHNPWPPLQDALLNAYAPLGQHSNYYAIDGQQWPPKALLRFSVQDKVVLISAGVSLRPQPTVESYFEDPSPKRRTELAICLAPPFAENESVLTVASYISGQAGLPWAHFTWLGAGHTMPCDAFQGGPGREFSFVLLVSSPPGAPTLHMPSFRGDPVSLLWLVPITDSERLLAQEQGSVALMQRLWAAGNSWDFRPRHSVA